MPLAIRVENLGKTFVSQSGEHRKVRALDGLSLDIEQGEVLGILGPNGAGKTTFLNILSTLVLPDQGRIEILGIPSIPRNFHALRSILNMSSGHPNFPWSLTVEENLRFYGRLYGLRGSALTRKVAQLIETFSLEDIARRRFDELSSGTKQRLSLAKALLNDPKIIFLDEPTIGLDPDVAAKTRSAILAILRRSKMTVLFTTHNMPEAEMMCQRIAFINRGRLFKVATPEELKIDQGKKTLEDVFIELAHETGEVLPRARPNLPSGPCLLSANEIRQLTGEQDSLWGRMCLWLNRAFAFTYRNTLFAIRNAFAFAELIFWPIMSLISIGLMGDFLELKAQALGFILTGAITAGVLQVTQLDVAYSLLYEVWSKSVKHTLLTPVGVSESLFGSWVNGIVRGTTIFIILSLAAIFLFGFKFPPLTVTLIYLLGIFASALLLGLLVTVLILLFGQKAEITAWMFAYLFMMLCGIYYPITTLSPKFYYLAQLIPITYFLEYFRQGFGFQTGISHLLLKGFCLIIGYLFVGMGVMRFAFKRARQRGTIVRLSE